jgi:hypothetical protein
MKAWDEIVNDPEIPVWYTGDKNNPDSHWYLDRGVKIERFPNGEVLLWNVMVPGHKYQIIAGMERQWFEDYGWKGGLYRFNWKYFEHLANTTSSEKDYDEYMTRSTMYRKSFSQIIAQ